MKRDDKMAELTTLRVERAVVDWLYFLKGFMEYNLSKKLTLNDALRLILCEADALFAIREGSVDPDNTEGLEKLVNDRIDKFWSDDDKDRPAFQFIVPRGKSLKHVNKKRKK